MGQRQGYADSSQFQVNSLSKELEGEVSVSPVPWKDGWGLFLSTV